MRDEATMYRLFTDIANADDRILAVYMNGSRTNPNVPKDIFQDYDIVFVVEDTKPFIEDKAWKYPVHAVSGRASGLSECSGELVRLADAV